MSATERWELTLTWPGAPMPFGLRSFSGREELSRPFRFQLELLPQRPPGAAAAELVLTEEACHKAVGTALTFGVRGPHRPPAHWHGIVTHFDVDYASHRCYGVVEPRLLALGRRADCRIFHDQTVKDIAEALLKEAGLTNEHFEFRLNCAKWRAWPICVQYRETNLNFFLRLLEHEGIFFYHEHSEKDHRLVLSDSSMRGVPLGNVRYIPSVQADDGVRGWRLSCSARPEAYALSDFNPLAPDAPLAAKAGEALEQFWDFPGEYETKDQGEVYAKCRLQEERMSAAVYSGEGGVAAFRPGATFHLTSAEIGGGDYLLTCVSHHAQDLESSDALYSNTFECVAKDVAFRPARLTPRPHIHSVQTAVVVDADGSASPAEGRQQTHPDSKGTGNVRVRFFWKSGAETQKDLCCWVPAAYAWAGPGFGSVFQPRIGQFVLIAFSEGLPERPIIVGSIFTAKHPRPLDPIGKAGSGIVKSRPTPGGKLEEGNVIYFGDEQGNEELEITAERFLDVHVKGDAEHKIAGDEIRVVRGEISLDVTKAYQQKVGGKFLLDCTDEVHLHAGDRVILSATKQLSLVVGDNFIDISAAGVAVNGTKVQLNCSGTAAAQGSPVVLRQPRKEKPPDAGPA